MASASNLAVWRVMASAVAAAVTLSGCGSDVGNDTDVVANAEGNSTAELSPLEQRLGFSSDESRRQRQQIELQRQAEAQVAACMAAQGFEYAPASIDQAVLPGRAGADGTRSWAEQNGLGITLAFVAARQAIERQGAHIDPNAAYLATLPSADAQEWVNALSGQVPETVDGDQIAYEPRGCLGVAFATVFARFELVDQFVDELESLNTRMAADPRVQRIVDEWSTCMAALGHDYLDQDDMADDVYARLLNVSAFTDDRAPVADSADEVAELLEFERAVAVANFDCSRLLDDNLTRIRAAYEREFIEDNRQRIDALPAHD